MKRCWITLKGIEAVAYVPSVWPLEVVNVLLTAERKKYIGHADSIRFISLLSQLPIVVDYENSQRVMHDLIENVMENWGRPTRNILLSIS